MATGNESTSSRSKVSIDPTIVAQFEVLSVLARIAPSDPRAALVDISVIAEQSGIRDPKDVQRYLYILEGQKLVAPSPEGDLTSKYWHITPVGCEMIKQYNRLRKGA